MSYLFSRETDGMQLQEGSIVPNNFIRASAVWIDAAGSAKLDAGMYQCNPHANWIFLALEKGEISFTWQDSPIRFREGNASFLPPCSTETSLRIPSQAHLYWFRLEGSLAAEFVRFFGALLVRPLPQRIMLCQMILAKQIASTAVRYSGTDAANFQLMQMLYAMLSTQYEQPIAAEGSVSREILHVLDALRENRYRDNPSLSSLAEIAKLPQETFRKRFVGEVGIPPLQYLIACKIARAKVLLLTPGWSVKAIAAEVGMDDPYRFSKQFKAVVGISPTDFRKLSALPLK